MEKKRYSHKFWLENLKVRQLARRKRRRQDNYKMQLNETGWNFMDRIHLARI
jgi:hypothetical protein